MKSDAVVTLEKQVLFWTVAAGALSVVLWLLSPVLAPFILGGVIAYFLRPPVGWMVGKGIPRGLATAFVLLSFAAAFIAAAAMVLPVLQGQMLQMLDAAPLYAERLQAWAAPYVDRLQGIILRDEIPASLKENAGRYAAGAFSWLSDFFRNLWDGGLAIVDVFSLVLVMPIVSFYMLRDWDLMIDRVNGWLPRKNAKIIRALFHDMDRIISGFIRGQALVCLALGLIYGVGLEAAGVNFGFLIGGMAGILSFIPYVGSIVGFVTAMAVAWFQAASWPLLGMVAAIFAVGQLLEGNVLTPRLVGERIGLHPLWILFALMAGGSLFGFVGVMVAVPVAAVIGVMVRFGMDQYLESSFFRGGHGR